MDSYWFAIIGGIKGKLTSSSFPHSRFLFVWSSLCFSCTTSPKWPRFSTSLSSPKPLSVSFYLTVFHSRPSSHNLFLAPSWTTQKAVSVCSSCSPAVAWVCVTLFPRGYDWGSPPTHARTPCSLHTSTHLTPLYCSAPHLFPFSCSCPKRIGEGWLLYQVQVSWVGEKGRRGYGCLSSGGEFIQPGIPHLWQVLTHMSQPVILCKKKPLWLNAIIKAIILCVATYTQETWQCCRAACSLWAIHG